MTDELAARRQTRHQPSVTELTTELVEAGLEMSADLTHFATELQTLTRHLRANGNHDTADQIVHIVATRPSRRENQ